MYQTPTKTALNEEKIQAKFHKLIIITFFVLDLGFDVIDRVAWFNLECDGLASQSLDKDLHTSTKTQYKMEGGFLLNVVVAQCASILQLLTSKDQSLLVWWDTWRKEELIMKMIMIRTLGLLS